MRASALPEVAKAPLVLALRAPSDYACLVGADEDHEVNPANAGTPPSEPEQGITIEFDLLHAAVTLQFHPVASDNPRETLSESELDDHLADLYSVAKARERAANREE